MYVCMYACFVCTIKHVLRLKLYFELAEPDFDYLEALAPFQPLQMKAAHCAIDTSLNFMQANKLIKDLKPTTLVIPECYTQPPSSAAHRVDLVIESTAERPLITFKRGDVINLPLKRKHNQVFVNDSIADALVPVEIKPGISLSSITGTLQVKDNILNMEVRSYSYFYLCSASLSTVSVRHRK